MSSCQVIVAVFIHRLFAHLLERNYHEKMLKKILLWGSLVVAALAVALLFLVPQKTGTPVEQVSTGGILGINTHAKLGDILTDAVGKTLYIFRNDKKGVSTCTGDCAKNWPPFLVSNYDPKTLEQGLSKNLNIIKRADGSLQYTYGPHALYYYAGDTKPGDTLGNNKNDLWSVIAP